MAKREEHNDSPEIGGGSVTVSYLLETEWLKGPLWLNWIPNIWPDYAKTSE